MGLKWKSSALAHPRYHHFAKWFKDITSNEALRIFLGCTHETGTICHQYEILRAVMCELLVLFQLKAIIARQYWWNQRVPWEQMQEVATTPATNLLFLRYSNHQFCIAFPFRHCFCNYRLMYQCPESYHDFERNKWLFPLFSWGQLLCSSVLLLDLLSGPMLVICMGWVFVVRFVLSNCFLYICYNIYNMIILLYTFESKATLCRH